MSSKELGFWAFDEESAMLVGCPEPASKSVPQWYKNLSRFFDSNKVMVRNGKSNSALKTCTPFLDATISGYIVSTHCDIIVERIQDQVVCSWTSHIAPMSSRGPEYAAQLPKIPGYGPFSQAWEMKYGFKVPRGYSVLVTQPMNRFTSPTYITNGIIDADEYLSPGGIPFAIAEDFEGIIPKGTPIIHLFPYKRDSWKSKLINAPFGPIATLRARNNFYGWYKENIWKKKNYV